MNDQQMKQLMFMMETSAGSVITGHSCLNDPDYLSNPEARKLAEKCFEEGALRLALCYSEFYTEIIERRLKSGNFQYPFEPDVHKSG